MSPLQRLAHCCLWVFVAAALVGLLWQVQGTVTAAPATPGLPAALALDT